MTKDELRKWITDEITMSGAIKINIPDAEINRVIDNETKVIYDKYRVALVEKYTIVPKALFYTPEFRRTRTLKFPPCIRTVDEVQELKGRASMWGINDPDISFTRAFQADLWMSPMGSDTVTFRTIQWNMWDQMKNFILTDMQHSWNEIEHTLLILGHDPTANVFIHMFEKIKPEILYDDPWVKKWIAAKCKKQVAKMLGIFSYNLIGGVTINATIYSEEADKDIEDCEKFFETLIHPDWFICFP